MDVDIISPKYHPLRPNHNIPRTATYTNLYAARRRGGVDIRERETSRDHAVVAEAHREEE